jgi:CRP/FNR family transcriptional regulator, cyclic AMP receptor protein
VKREHAARVLAASELFQSVPESRLFSLMDHASFRALAQAAPLFLQNEEESSLYVVLSGEVRIVASSQEGHALFHRLIGVGEVFGEIALLDGGPRTAGAIANQDSELLCIDRRSFHAFLEQNASVAIRLATMLARRIRSTSALLEDAIFLSARDRVAKKLLELARQRSRENADDCMIEDLTHETLAAMTGLHRVSVTNQLKELERGGLLRLARRTVHILRIAELEALCTPEA